MTKFYQIMKTDIAVIEISDEEMREFGYEEPNSFNSNTLYTIR